VKGAWHVKLTAVRSRKVSPSPSHTISVMPRAMRVNGFSGYGRPSTRGQEGPVFPHLKIFFQPLVVFTKFRGHPEYRENVGKSP
jgi:hypothetical protein